MSRNRAKSEWGKEGGKALVFDASPFGWGVEARRVSFQAVSHTHTHTYIWARTNIRADSARERRCLEESLCIYVKREGACVHMYLCVFPYSQGLTAYCVNSAQQHPLRGSEYGLWILSGGAKGSGRSPCSSVANSLSDLWTEELLCG